MTNARAHRYWLLQGYVWTAIVVADMILALLGSAGGWALILSAPGAAFCWTGWTKTRPAPPPPPRRAPAYGPGAAPAGHCQICGQHDPDHLVQGWHESCVEWLGYPPFASGGVVSVGVTMAEAVTALTTITGRRRVEVTTLGDPNPVYLADISTYQEPQ